MNVIAVADVLFRYVNGEFTITGWGIFWLLLLLVSIGSIGSK